MRNLPPRISAGGFHLQAGCRQRGQSGQDRQQIRGNYNRGWKAAKQDFAAAKINGTSGPFQGYGPETDPAAGATEAWMGWEISSPRKYCPLVSRISGMAVKGLL